MAAETAPSRLPARLLGLGAACWLLQTGVAAAFPFTDPMNPGIVPSGADLPAPDAAALRNQMGLLSGFNSAGAGWTISPQVSLEEVFNDNVLDAHSPRRWDFGNILAPSVAVAGNLSRIDMRLDYAPMLEIYDRTPSQNALTQQLNGTALVTLVPDALFVDVRALAGVQATNGGIGGVGGLGVNGLAANGLGAQPNIGSVGTTPLAGQTDLGLSKQNRTQASSFSISPYLLHHFGDIGDGKIGASFNQSNFSQVSGFAPIPFASSGSNTQSQTTVEENAQFATGDILSALRDTVTADASQSEATSASGGQSTRDTISNRVDYVLNRNISVYGDIGWESIKYGGSSALTIHDVTWGFGTTLTPNPDSQVTVGYGHLNGQNSLTFDGHYALTPRTMLTASYYNGIGTQLQQLANQLNQGSVGNNGNLVNSQTGGQLFAANNALGVSNGVFRYSDFTAGATTVLDRDTFSLSLSYSQNSQLGSGAPASVTDAKTVGISWVRQVNPDLGLSASVYYSLGSAVAGAASTSIAANAALQYSITPTLSAFARYALYDRESNSSSLAMYQNLVLVGITKQF